MESDQLPWNLLKASFLAAAVLIFYGQMSINCECGPAALFIVPDIAFGAWTAIGVIVLLLHAVLSFIDGRRASNSFFLALACIAGLLGPSVIGTYYLFKWPYPAAHRAAMQTIPLKKSTHAKQLEYITETARITVGRDQLEAYLAAERQEERRENEQMEKDRADEERGVFHAHYFISFGFLRDIEAQEKLWKAQWKTANTISVSDRQNWIISNLLTAGDASVFDKIEGTDVTEIKQQSLNFGCGYECHKQGVDYFIGERKQPFLSLAWNIKWD